MRTLDPPWRPLLGQVLDDRRLGFDIAARPRPGLAQTAREFRRRERAARHHPPRASATAGCDDRARAGGWAAQGPGAVTRADAAGAHRERTSSRYQGVRRPLASSARSRWNDVDDVSEWP